ncbi:hypothetical protein ACQP2F_35090 [Actinoplanes sp. CA-030573]|uniref:hypothetical protein n=1 Tax=Actinoplanes sp. CA-030573 TaxID=3239898 RepID=UPI003D8E6897
MTDAASRVRIVLAALPGLLYRITTPAGSGLAPRVTGANGRIRAALLPTGADGPDEVLIVLNRDVRWDIRLPRGAGEQQLDLRRGRVTRVEVGASGLVEMSLPAPAGTVPVTLGGPVGSVVLGADPGVPLRLTLGAGAGAVRTPWGASLAAAPGAVVQAPGWVESVRRYAVSARSPVGRVLVRGPF